MLKFFSFFTVPKIRTLQMGNGKTIEVIVPTGKQNVSSISRTRNENISLDSNVAKPQESQCFLKNLNVEKDGI